MATWANIDIGVCRHMVSLGRKKLSQNVHNGFTGVWANFCGRIVYIIRIYKHIDDMVHSLTRVVPTKHVKAIPMLGMQI